MCVLVPQNNRIKALVAWFPLSYSHSFVGYMDVMTPTHPSRSRSKINHPIPAREMFPVKIMLREENSPGPETTQLSASLYYTGDTNFPEYT